MQASIHLRLQPVKNDETASETYSIPMDPIVILSPKVRSFLGFSDTNISEEQMSQTSEVANALISGCRGAMKRGPIGAYEMANIKCYVEDIDADGGLSALNALPGVLRAASSTILATLLNENKSSCSTLEPIMSVEISVPVDMVGNVLSDLTTRRGTVGDVIMGDSSEVHSKAMVHGSVPLSEILGYANSLRSITAGEGSFSAEYEGHAPFD
jgi:elongation factor G